MTNEFTVTPAVFRSWGVENMFKGDKLKFRIGWTIIACSSIFLATQGEVYYIVLAIFCIYCGYIRNFVWTRAQYNRMATIYGMKNWTRHIFFNEENIVIAEGKQEFRYDYSDIIKIKSKENKIWLVANNKTVIRMYKNSFKDSTWKECKAFLKSKCDNLEEN